MVDATTLPLSFDRAVSLPGAGWVANADVVEYRASALGEASAGTFAIVFDGSDVGLTQAGEDVDAVDRRADGSLLMSTTGQAGVPGVTAQDEDLLAFSPTALGPTTTGM